jgi:hypothetical protein
LRDERIGESRSTAAPEYKRPQQSGPLPVAFHDLQQREPQKPLSHLTEKSGLAQHLRKDDRREDALALLEGELDGVDVGPLIPAQIRNERAAIQGDHRRSWRRVFRSTENLTFPRRARKRSYASPAATSSNPRLMVAVTPSPVHRWARRSNAPST